ncbi:hypothetical protein L3X38_006094 [Prunus dulcis]|uniref:Uncharacterized protein n=1 Tax=Prunus dulcis TaxID=3755 RepID=A0AAD4ZS53_PRUDU|nr:hypothetical protein L3X38_006094 [Prunus dulcis]
MLLEWESGKRMDLFGWFKGNKFLSYSTHSCNFLRFLPFPFHFLLEFLVETEGVEVQLIVEMFSKCCVGEEEQVIEGGGTCVQVIARFC